MTPTPLRPTPLRPDSACCRDLNWRTDLPAKEGGEVEGRLLDRGWTQRCRHQALRVLRHPEGHELAWVLTTGRVQLRVGAWVPQSERAERARSLYDELVASCGA